MLYQFYYTEATRSNYARVMKILSKSMYTVEKLIRSHAELYRILQTFSVEKYMEEIKCRKLMYSDTNKKINREYR